MQKYCGKILIYPEQSMWYNYRKPKPLKVGAFSFAVKNNVPVLPIFITCEDTENFDRQTATLNPNIAMFIRSAKRLGKPVVVVLQNGGDRPVFLASCLGAKAVGHL